MPGVKIGILGGIGPEATGEFYTNLIKKLQETNLIKSNKNFPQIIINSIPAPELIKNRISNKDLEPYIKGLKELDRLDPDFIVIVCNTIHLFYDKLQNQINTPIVDLRKEVKKYLKEKNLKKVLIIGTPSTINKDLYGKKLIKPTEEEIKILSDSIFNFNRGYKKQEQIDRVKKICNKDVDAVLLACTEFAMILKDENIKKINTIDILVNTTRELYLKTRKDLIYYE